MPIIRKLQKVGPTSKAVVIPKSWLQFYEQEKGESIEQVAIEVDEVLTITPFLPKTKKKKKVD